MMKITDKRLFYFRKILYNNNMLFIFNTINIALIITIILNFFLGIIVFLDGSRKRINIVYVWNIIAIISWVLVMIFYRLAPQETALFWCVILYITPTLIASTFLYFTYIFPSQREEKLWWRGLLIFLINLIIKEVNIRVGLEKEIIFTKYYIIYFLYTFSFFFYGFYRLFKKYRQSHDIERSQILYLLLGDALATTFAFVTNLVMPWMGYFYLNWLGQVFTVIMVLFTVYAIIAHHLMNIKLITTELFAGLLVIITLANVFQNINGGLKLLVSVIVFIITLTFAALLIRSVLKEVKRREEMEKLAVKLSKTTKKLQKANKELKQLDETKSTFISIASHQLRTPLTAIKGYGSMLLTGDFGELKDEKQKGAINKMFVSGGRLIALVDNLLNVSRIESGRVKYSFKLMNLENLVEDVCRNLQNSAQTEELYLKYQKPIKPLPKINMDEEKIRQVVINFVDNAIKYTKKGGITVSVFRKSGAIQCCVADTGIGMSKNTQTTLFKKFSRGKNAFTVNTEGNGLGLYVAHMMVAGHQGHIWAESDGEGKGSKFCFSIPLGKGGQVK